MDERLLEKIDLIRERLNVSYQEARLALEQSEGNVVEALVSLEQRAKEGQAKKQAERDLRREEFTVRGNELVDTVKGLVQQGNISKIRVLHKQEVLFEISLVAGVAFVLLLPNLALLAGIAMLFGQVTIQVEHPAGGFGMPDNAVKDEGELADCEAGCTEQAFDQETTNDQGMPQGFTWSPPAEEPKDEPEA